MRGDSQRRRRLRILTLVDGLGVTGGGERLATEMAIRLDPERFDSMLCVSRWSEDAPHAPGAAELLARVDAAGVRFLGLSRSSTVDLGAWAPLLSTLRSGVDVLHSHKFGSNVWAAALGTVARTPVIVAHEHSWSFEGQRLRRFFDRELVGRRASAIVAVSRADERRMAEVEGIAPEKLVFIPNGIPDPPTPSGRDLRPELRVARDAPVVGSVSGLRSAKGLDVLAAASALVRKRFPDLRVLVAGEGEDRAMIEAEIRRFGLEETMILLGRRTDVPDLLRTFDVAAVSSVSEGSPLAVMEYMEAALPIVATQVGGVPDLIEHRVSGLLVPPSDPAALATGIETLLRDRRTARELGYRAQLKRRTEFRIDVTVRRVEELYERLLGRTGSTKTRQPIG